MTSADVPGGEAGRDLYGLDPAEFTAARNALAKRLRAEGDKAQAALVAKLRRPPATAWALNKVAREQGGVIDAVLEAGAALRSATEDALGGDASALRTARAWERRAVNAGTNAAAGFLSAAGQGAGDAHKQRMAGTLRAAMVDGTVAAALREGVLDDDREAPGFGLDAFSPAAAGSATGRRRPAGERTTSSATDADPADRHPAPARAANETAENEESNPVVAEAAAGTQEAAAAEAERTARQEAGAAAAAEAARAERRAAQLGADADDAEGEAVTARHAAASARAEAQRATAAAERLEAAAEAAGTRSVDARAAAEQADAEAGELSRRAAALTDAD